MAVSRINYSLKQKQVGLTLIEVLIALAIMSIAMTAIIKATSQNIRSTAYLQNKTMALWVGKQIMNEVRLGLLILPKSSETKEKTLLLEREWTWQAKRSETPNKRIDKIEVEVYENDKEDTASLISLESYVYHELSQ
jgi:general secretion pathway protein I